MADLSFLPYGRQSIDEADIAAVATALEDDFLTTGPRVAAFERDFAATTGARFAVASNSGTAALHLACLAIDLKPGEWVVVPTVTFLATANAARFCGADVIFADVDEESGLMTEGTLAAALAAHPEKTIRAVLPVHLNGHCVALPAIRDLAASRGLAVIEDACHALGGRHQAGNGRLLPVGSCALAEMACFSLHPVKTMTTGEGGVTTTNDEALYRRMLLFRSHGMTRDAADFVDRGQATAPDGQSNPWYYEMQALGFNYRLTDFACALGSAQLARLSDFVARRRRLTACYDRLIAPLAPLLRPVPADPRDEAALHLYVVRIDFKALGKSRARVMAELKEQGIGTMVHYLPVHRQPYYRARYGALDLPGADRYYECALSLPLYPALREADIERVVEALRRLGD